jgi:signal transduction histidine kinase/HAMP domain-containing protein
MTTQTPAGESSVVAPTRRRLLVKLVTGVTLAILAIELIILVPSLVTHRARLRAPRTMTAEVLAHGLTQPLMEALSRGDQEMAVRVVSAASADRYVHMVILVGLDRSTIACSVPAHIGLLHRSPAVEAVLAPGGPDEATAETDGLYAAARVVRGPDGAPLGAIEVATDLRPIPSELIAYTVRTLGVVLIIMVFTGCVIGLYLWAIVLKPVWRIVRANVAAAQGDRSQAYVPPGEIPDDEIGDIARTRNEMLAKIEAHSQDLETLVLRGIGDPITLLDADRRVLVRNRPGPGPAVPAPGACECGVHGLAPDLGQDVCPVALSLASGRPQGRVFTVEGPDGARFYEAQAFPIVDGGNGEGTPRPMRVVEQVRDVTERHHLETVARRNERLATVGEMAAGMAHEIRNPLATIVASADLLTDEPDRSAEGEGRVLLGILKTEARRVNRLLTDFLTFARPRPLMLAPTDVNATVRGIAGLVRAHPGNGGRVTVRTALDGGLPVIDADADLVEQALLNIAINGLEAMPEGGVLTLVTAQVDGGVEVAVVDTGVGIDEADRNRIFEPFHTTKAEGTGLGLAITYRIVERHGGAIVIDGRPGEGTTVRMRLPRTPRGAS